MEWKRGASVGAMGDQHVRSGVVIGLHQYLDLHSVALSTDKAGGLELGNLLRARREELGLFQHELAMLASVSSRYVHMLESGKTSVRLDTMSKVLDVLGLHLSLQVRPEPLVVTLT